jgi:hypothetical protein
MVYKAGLLDDKKGSMPQSVRTILNKMGWTEYDSDKHEASEINLYFIKRPKIQDIPSIIG